MRATRLLVCRCLYSSRQTLTGFFHASKPAVKLSFTVQSHSEASFWSQYWETNLNRNSSCDCGIGVIIWGSENCVMSASLEQIRAATRPYLLGPTGLADILPSLLEMLEDADQESKPTAEAIEGLLAL